MGPHETVQLVELVAAAPSARRLPVSHLQPGDLVFDRSCRTHLVESVHAGSNGTVWIQRADLTFREHLSGTITAVFRGHAG